MKMKSISKKPGGGKVSRSRGNPTAQGVSVVSFAGPKSTRTANNTTKRTVGLLAVGKKKKK